jgi:hypothetical protein
LAWTGRRTRYAVIAGRVPEAARCTDAVPMVGVDPAL